MAAAATISKEEGLGLGLALAAHVALFAFLALHEPAREPLPIPERMDVSLASEVSLTSTAPDAVSEAQASVAPELAPVPAPPEPLPAPQQVREPVQPEPRPTRPVVQPSPRPTARATPTPRPTARATPASRPTARPTSQPSPRASTRPTPAPTASARPGGSRIGSDFLAGSGTSERSDSRGTVAAAFGAAEQASLESAINRQLKPHWSAPSGLDSELLVTVLSWELNADGTLKGRPTVVSQSGINDSNRPQASLHAERAIRAVQLAAPFNLPDQFYDKWKRIRTWRFDRRL